MMSTSCQRARRARPAGEGVCGMEDKDGTGTREGMQNVREVIKDESRVEGLYVRTRSFFLF